MKTALVGGSGFIGRAVANALAAGGHEIVVLARRDRGPEDAQFLRCDATGAIDPAVFEGCDAVVNLVGIKREEGDNTFEAAHVRAVENVIEAMHAAGVRRLVHISVSASRASNDPYLHTKHRGEQMVEGSGLEFTILRPAVVYGSGDDMLHNLAKAIRQSPVFPAPGGGHAKLAVVDVRDVALAVRRSLERPASIGCSYDIVGPEDITLRDLVARVATATQLRTAVLGVPVVLQRIGAGVMEKVLRDPPITTAQLGMLTTGVVGDPNPARRDLELDPRPFTPERIVELTREPRNQVPLFGLSVRAQWNDAQRQAAAAVSEAGGHWWRLLAGIAVLNATMLLIDQLWWRVAATYLLLLPLMLFALRPKLRSLFRIDAGTVGAGLLAGTFVYGAGALVVTALTQWAPAVDGQIEDIYAAANAFEASLAIPMLLFVVFCEDVFWRVGVGMGLAGRYGPWTGILVSGLGFGLAHLTVGPPVLWPVAVACGLFWSWLALRTRSFTAPFVSHVVFDVTAMWILPLG